LVFSVTDDVSAVAFRGAVGDAFGVAAEYAGWDVGCEGSAVPGRMLADGNVDRGDLPDFKVSVIGRRDEDVGGTFVGKADPVDCRGVSAIRIRLERLTIVVVPIDIQNPLPGLDIVNHDLT
jgi:hypothetical protein